MESLYSVVVTVILLFPWSLVGLMVAGALRHRRKGR
jgi:hypothetical protein